MDGARLQLLGGFSLMGPCTDLAPAVGIQRLLAYLALYGPSHRCVVAGTLWRDVPDDQALASLRTGIWRMNRTLPGVLSTDGERLSLAPVVGVDSRELEVLATRLLCQHPDDGTWPEKEIEVLWRGDLLPGWYDDWVLFERERLNQLRLHAMERLATVLTARRQLDTALRLALEAVRIEPLRETATAALISVYLAEGNVSDAVGRYQTFAGLLRQELGLDPSPSLGRLLPVRARRDAAVTIPGR